MSWHYLQDQEAASWEANSLDGAPVALLSLMPTPGACCWLASETDTFPASRSGTMSGLSTASPGAAQSMSSAGASHAKTSARRAKERESTALVAGSGWKWPESSVKYDLATCLWRTRQSSLLAGLDVFSETWPRWGMMRDGECWELSMPELHTSASESGLWPTPNVPNGGRSVKHVTDWRGKSAYHNGKKVQVGLESAVKMLPTPTADDTGHRTKPYAQGGTPLSMEAGGSLNPTWVEWLMGWPLGWTDLKALETAKFQQWQRLHGVSSPETSMNQSNRNLTERP